MIRACVLDASAVLSVLAVSQATPAATSFFLDASREWHAPTLLRLEARNALHLLGRRGVIEIGSNDESLMLLETEIRFIETDDATLLHRIVARARAASLSVYDATYLEAARRGNAALATRDVALLTASRAAEIETFDLR